MPVEAIHLSAFEDSLAHSNAPSWLCSGRPHELGRLGALIIDFPYFERFPLGVLRYLLRQPTARSPWGDALHHTTPVAVAHSMLSQVRALRKLRSTRPKADEVLALCLGYVSHLAVDRSLHPLVNTLARERAGREGGDAAHHHTEVEKFHSVLFHEERLGFDFMGRRELAEYINVDAHAVHREAHLYTAWTEGLRHALGDAPERSSLRNWSRGYRQYVALVSSPLGKRLVPDATKKSVRPEVYEGPWGAFPARYACAVEASRAALEAAFSLAEDDRFQDRFEAVLPEGPIDLG